jgi:hypothetical protein
MTALMLAAMHGDTEILEVLLEAVAAIDVQDKVLTASLLRTVHKPSDSCCFCLCRPGERHSCGHPRRVTLRPLFAC